jgi:N-acetylneuraminate synthase
MSFKSLIHNDYVIIIAEIGINHNGSISIAKELITGAHVAGANAVKFQFRDIDNTYMGKKEIGDEIISEELNKNALTPVEIIELGKYAKDLGLLIGISFFDLKDIAKFEILLDFFDFFKIPSVELTNTTLIDKLLSINKFLLISTGGADEQSIEDCFGRINGDGWMPLHCISNYPTAIYNSNLGYMNFLSKRWSRPVGYSSHDSNWSVVIAAILLGAKVIERHITLNKEGSGLDHTSSSTIEEFILIVEFARNKKIVLKGNDKRTPNQGELLNMQNLGRSFYSKRDIQIGEKIDKKDFAYLSPKIGFGNTEFDRNSGAVAVNKIHSGDVLNYFHINGRSRISEKAIEFANSKNIGLPVRLHDYKEISKIFNLDNYEFHLSFGEIPQLNDFDDINYKHKFTVHLPDYYSSNELINPFSTNKSIRNESLKIINETISFAARLSDLTDRNVGVVGSFSIAESGLDSFYTDCADAMNSVLQDKVTLAIQWLPPVAWYFGGSVKINVMNNINDVEYISSKNINIVMDSSHLFMGKNFFGFDAKRIIEELEPFIKWFHISGASGIDGEGNNFTTLDESEYQIIDKIIESDTVKIIEVWQGHLDKFLGFKQALENLEERFNHE